MIVRMHWRFASERRAGELAAAIRNDLVHVHIELSTTACHPNMQREHVVMLAGENLVACLNDQVVLLVAQSFTVVVGNRGGLFQDRIRRDHLAGNEILTNAEMLEGTLGLCTPELICRHFNETKAV